MWEWFGAFLCVNAHLRSGHWRGCVWEAWMRAELPSHRNTWAQLESPTAELTQPSPSPWFRHSFCGLSAHTETGPSTGAYRTCSFRVPMIQGGQPELQSSCCWFPWPNTHPGPQRAFLQGCLCQVGSQHWRGLWLPRCWTWLFPLC